MKDILIAPWMVEMIRTATNMYNHGWGDRMTEFETERNVFLNKHLTME